MSCDPADLTQVDLQRTCIFALIYNSPVQRWRVIDTGVCFHQERGTDVTGRAPLSTKLFPLRAAISVDRSYFRRQGAYMG